MKEALSKADATNRTRQDSAQWYQATTLTERILSLRKNTSRLSTAAQANTEKAALRLKQWKSQPPFNKSEHSFAQRLALDDLTEEDLLALLAQPAEEIEALFSIPPTWLIELFNSFGQQDTVAQSSLPFEKLDDPQANAAFQVIKPLLAHGFAKLQSGIAELPCNYSRLPFDPQTIGTLLFPHVLDQLLSKLTKTLVLELNVARVRGRLQGKAPKQRFDFFLQQLAQPENMLALLEEYPVLARQLVEWIERWVSCELELLQRLCADWSEICSVFAPESDPGILIKIHEGAGDVHQGGRSVTMLTWSSGLRLVYKPRSLAVDAHFQELLTWLNTHGCWPTFRVFKLLQKEEYGWCEFVSANECTSEKEIERFYQRLGGYLALFYALEATDFHAENLIAVGEDPMFIDLEALFQPRIDANRGSGEYSNKMLTYSVRRVGMLPRSLGFGEEPTGVDLSSLGAQGDQVTPFAVAVAKEQGTDQMHLVKERIGIKLDGHQPTLQGQQIDVLKYEQNIIRGFTTVYRLLLQHRDELLASILPRFAHDEIRVLLRVTQIYALIRIDSFHPNVLRDALDRERLFDRLWIGIEDKPYMARAIAAERADLLCGDIPKFTTSPTARDLCASRGELIADFFPQSSLDSVRKCIQHLDEQDLERQIWIIQISFANLALSSARIQPKRSLQLPPTPSQATRARLVAEATAIGDRLQRLALIQEDTVGWLVIKRVGGQEWRPVMAGPDLYNGLSGISLFLAYLGMISGKDRYTALARLTLKTLRELFLSKKQPWRWSSTGVFEGIGSLIYLFSHLGAIWHEPALYLKAEELAAQVSELISSEESFDILNGTAGCIVALLSLYAVAPGKTTLAVAMQCGDHLLKHARPMAHGIGWSPKQGMIPLAGMSHGNAGIAMSLLRLAAVSKEEGERFRQAAFEAIEYERSLFSPEKRNWPDLRDSSAFPAESNSQAAGEQDYSYMTAWCHGAPGIGLARLDTLQYNDNAATRAEIDAAIQTTLMEGFGRNHSLCHGDMGSLELLLAATQLLPGQYSREKLESLQASLLESMQTQGWQSGIPVDIETPDLMLGLAGTGYELLRLAAAEQIPSILLVDPPKTALRFQSG